MNATRLAVLAIGVLCTLCAALATAQTTYRWIDKNGKTVYSDQPPPPGARQVVKNDAAAPRDAEANAAPQSFATRRAAEAYPVTLYTSANCVEPCVRARALLNTRGVPFSEKLLKNEAEFADLGRQTGREATVPTLFVGRQYVAGLEEGAWNNLLDLAAYPKSAPYGAKPSGALAQ